MSSSTRRLATTAVSTVLALGLLSGCAQEEPTNDEQTSSAPTSAEPAPTTDESEATSEPAPRTDDESSTDAAPTTEAPPDDAAVTTGAEPLVVSAADGSFEVTLPEGWIDAIDLVDRPEVQVAGRAPEQVDGFFTNAIVTQEEYVGNLTAAAEETAKELAGEDGTYELLEPAPVDGNLAPGYTLHREVSGKELVHTQRWISHDGTLYVVTLSALASEAEEAAPLLDEMLASWTWND